MNFPLFGKGQQTKHVKGNAILVADLMTEASGNIKNCWKLEVGSLV